MYLIYNCGYYLTRTLVNPQTGSKYFFKKRFVTEVTDKDGQYFLSLTAKDIPWCPSTPKTYPPFMTLDDYCGGEQGRYDIDSNEKFDPEEYVDLFLLKKPHQGGE